MPLGTEVLLGPAALCSMGTQLPLKEWRSRHISARAYCGETVVCIRLPLGTEVGLSLGDIGIEVDPAPSPQKRHSPQFSAIVCCGETAGWTKMPLGIEEASSEVTLC